MLEQTEKLNKELGGPQASTKTQIDYPDSPMVDPFHLKTSVEGPFSEQLMPSLVQEMSWS